MANRILTFLVLALISIVITDLSNINFFLLMLTFQISYMISAWARMCKIMGKDFEQYLPLVMGPVLKAAALKPEVALLDSMHQ